LELAIDLTGNELLLGLWIAQTEGAKFWLQVLTYQKDRNFHLLRRWFEGLPRGDRIGIPTNFHLAVRGAHGASLFELPELEDARGGCD
jgi:hypothetical protein